MKRNSLKFRLLFWYAAWLVGILFFLGVILDVGLSQSLSKEMGFTEQRRAVRIAETIRAWHQFPTGRSLAQEIDLRFAPQAKEWLFRVSDTEGHRIYPVVGTPDPLQGIPIAPQLGVQTARLPTGMRLVIGRVKTDGGGWIEAAESLEPIYVRIHQAMALFLGVASIFAAMALVGAWLLVRQTLAPVEQIAAAAARITSNSLSERLPVPSQRDEIAHLTETLNQMITRLDEAFQLNDRFLADASHELRTPLTILRGELEQTLRDPQLEPGLQSTLGNLLEEAERLSHLVDSLLTLSRLDSGQAHEEWAPVDLSDVASLTAEQMELLAEDKTVTMTCQTSVRAWVFGDRARLKQIVVNLLDNAIKYTHAGGQIIISVRSIGEEAILEVQDTGVGIPEAALPHLFERFFRVDKARSRELGGVGIGLSIVKAICQAHHGHVEVESRPGFGSTFRVFLPRSPAQT